MMHLPFQTLKFFTEKRVDFMKRVLAVLMCAVLLTGCFQLEKKETTKKQVGVWLTYSEVNSMLDGDFKAEFQKLIKNCKTLEVKNLYIHIRAFGDSLYKSKYFPLNEKAQKYDFDILKYVITLCHKNGISVHAWINPYRISTATQNVDEINNKSPAYLWQRDAIPENDKNVCFSDGIYLNPAESEVRRLILNGVREVVKNYDIDGIHYDDYFYPTQSEEFDKASYDTYIKTTNNPLSLADWRRANVDALISGTYNAIKFEKSGVIFSVSPAASVDNNFENLYADVSSWVKNGYVDVIMPQLYFGFEYPDEDFKFSNLLNAWKELSNQNENVKLIIGLAFYKAKPTLSADITEWQENDDIIARQVDLIEKDSKADGWVYFSYSSLFSEAEEFKNQRENLKERQ